MGITNHDELDEYLLGKPAERKRKRNKRWLVTVVYMKQFEVDAQTETEAYDTAERSSKLTPQRANMSNWYVREVKR